MSAFEVVLFATANYYFTTLAIWVGHWFSHLSYSPTHEFHVGGHHALYPHSRGSLSERFLYGTGSHDSLFALLPALVLQGLVIGFCTHGWLRWLLEAEAVAISFASSWLHAQFHIGGTFLRRYEWFRKARREHWVHHDEDMNFMVGDLFWDRVFQTHKFAVDDTVRSTK